MFKKILVITTIVVSLTLLQAPLAQDSDSENAKTRLNKEEILDLMVQVGRMPSQQQSSKIDALWQASSAGTTPRSDFLFCTGLAYLGNYKAQRCVASAFENGRGIVEDQSEAYTWYAIALENKIPDKAAEQMIEADKDRVTTRLLSAYPHPTEDELNDLVQAQQTRLAQYREDVKKARK